MTYKPFITYLFTMLLLLCSMISSEAQASEWLYYDEGEPVHAGSGLRYQGVRFSLSGDSVKSPLLQVAFYYSTANAFCPVRIHITDHSHTTRPTDHISYDAVNGWNYLDLSAFGISVPHNFYVILENRTCGSLMLDNHEISARSFKGNYLKSMITRLSHDLLIRAEVGESWEIPALNRWDATISEKIIIQQIGLATQTIVRDFGEAWILYNDASFATSNNMYGIWKHKKQKFQISLDPEEVREHLIDSFSDYVTNEISEVLVAKTIFTGKIDKDGNVTGTLKIFAKMSFFDTPASAKVTVERKFRGILAALSEPEAIVEQP